jgi:recombinational DNA repair ATPase RecF
MTGSLRDRILARLEADVKAESPWDLLVLAALEGPQALEAALGQPERSEGSGDARHPERAQGSGGHAERAKPPKDLPGAYIKSIAVEGFRGVGPKATLELTPGPGLTLVVGRNGSGKSSFAEALELLLTGDTFRWAGRNKVWRDGWRNLHHTPAAIEAEFHIEGERGATQVAQRWEDDAELTEAATTAQIHGKPRTDLAALGWDGPLETYRPFLSYNELGSMLEEGASKLYDALSSILGLDELVGAQEALKGARTSRERAQKDAGELHRQIVQTLGGIEDERAKAVAQALDRKDWGLDDAQAVLARTSQEPESAGLLSLLRQLANMPIPDAAAAKTTAQTLRDADERMKQTAGTVAGRSDDLAAILDHALRYHQAHGDGNCPVCGRPKALDKAWHDKKAGEIQQLRDAAREASAARSALNAAVQQARGLIARASSPETLTRAGEAGLDPADALKALEPWAKAATITDPQELAKSLVATSEPLATALTKLREAARTELQRREDQWTPIAQQLARWLPQARAARKGAEAVPQIKAAEKWLKDASEGIRNERFAPIAEKAIANWEQLRVQSNVALGRVYLGGSGSKRHVELDVNVDGVPGAALGVMSQGELHSLALSLFIPRATLPESPFRFIVIDDPVQSMDPARVDGLARVLESAARDRQVLVFTHDDRLPGAIRRLAITASVLEVTRREGSVVEPVKGRDPVARHVADAFALAQTDGIPAAAAQRVIPGLCRMAIEAACIEAVRRRRLSRGERHADVEDALAACTGTKAFVSLALFDDVQRAGDVLPRLDKESRDYADVYRMCNEGAHGMEVGARIGFIRQAERLARWLQARK